MASLTYKQKQSDNFLTVFVFLSICKVKLPKERGAELLK